MTISRMLAYGQWANALLHTALASVPEALLDTPQSLVFGSIRATAQHVVLMGQVWQAHLTGQPHTITSRNPATSVPLAQIATAQAALDAWAIAYAASLTPQDMAQSVPFTFIDGGASAMTRGEILLHLVNHATYHRGHIAAMLNAGGHSLPASDLPVYCAAFPM